MIEIAQGLAALTQAIGVAKQISEAKSKLDQAELKGRLADLYTMLADAKMALADAQVQLQEKDRTIAELRRSQERAGPVLYRGFPFAVDNGRVSAGPYCPNCYERKSMVLLARTTAVLKTCPRCKGQYGHAPMGTHLQEVLDKKASETHGAVIQGDAASTQTDTQLTRSDSESA